MCKPDRSCSVNEDNGIMLAHTITHELGHNFGLYHDTEKIGCHRRDGATLHIMTPIFEADTVQVAWSRCMPDWESALATDHHRKKTTFTPKHLLCHLMFGAQAVVCAKLSEVCETLWCLVNDHCQTMLRPAAPGTTCGENMVGFLVKNICCIVIVYVFFYQMLVTISDGWLPVVSEPNLRREEPVARTTRRRLERVERMERMFSNLRRWRLHSIQSVQHGSVPYQRADVQGDRRLIEIFVPDKPCELQCIAKETDLEMLNGFVADGTPCKQSLGARDMCIAGCYDTSWLQKREDTRKGQPRELHLHRKCEVQENVPFWSSYTVDAKRLKQYHYRLSEWSSCSASCGTGYMRRQPECVDKHNRVVEQSQCYNIEPPRHEALMQRCRNQPCPIQPPHTRPPHAHARPPPVHARSPTAQTHWWVGNWNPCSKQCHMP
ncbi:A disintegrin and metalloproteinase with thrombospondin motifs 7, partial [Operophtera brumata]